MPAKAVHSTLPFAATMLLALAGCAGPGATGDADAAALLAALEWPTMRVRTTPVEPFELTGPIQAKWSGDRFAVWAEVEPDLDRRTVVEAGVAYTNDNPEMGWTKSDLMQGIAAGRLSNRIALWDLPRLLAGPAFALEATESGNTLNLTAHGNVTIGGRPMEVRVELGAVDGRVVWARQASAQAREAPYTFRADAEAFPFPVTLPAAPLESSKVTAGNLLAHAGHSTVIRLLQDYAFSHGGTVPDEPSASSLAVELIASGKDWPKNAFTGEDLAVGPGSGDIGWTKCGLSDAAYNGWGWDGALLTQGFGRGCR